MSAPRISSCTKQGVRKVPPQQGSLHSPSAREGRGWWWILSGLAEGARRQLWDSSEAQLQGAGPGGCQRGELLPPLGRVFCIKHSKRLGHLLTDHKELLAVLPPGCGRTTLTLLALVGQAGRTNWRPSCSLLLFKGRSCWWCQDSTPVLQTGRLWQGRGERKEGKWLSLLDIQGSSGGSQPEVSKCGRRLRLGLAAQGAAVLDFPFLAPLQCSLAGSSGGAALTGFGAQSSALLARHLGWALDGACVGQPKLQSRKQRLLPLSKERGSCSAVAETCRGTQGRRQRVISSTQLCCWKVSAAPPCPVLAAWPEAGCWGGVRIQCNH
ncbi:uncharacterized protein LOC135182493 [Pogoniulus pusillus]|uniref:uncharacterized protein LOC135182493 n=1 Tax=Pogoniulus pusillus TaxID=488313 RepID=UPI0030B9A4CA